MDSAPDSSSRGKPRQQKRGRHGEDGASMQEMQISIDSQSFVNLGQLMGSRHGGPTTATSGGSSNAPGGVPRVALEDLDTSFLSDDSEGLRDFDHFFHPAAEHGGSTPSPWPGRELYDQGGTSESLRGEGGGRGRDDEDDDNDSLLPALPSRSSTPGSPRGDSDSGSNKPSYAEAVEAGWAEEDFSSGGAAAGADACGGGEERAGRASSSGDRSASAATSGGASIGRADSRASDRRQTTPVAAAFMKPAAQPGLLARGDGAEDSSSACAIAAGGATRAARAQPSDSSVPAAAAAAAAAASATAASNDGGATAAGAATSKSSPLLRESWLHVPMGDNEDYDGDGSIAPGPEDDRAAAGGERAELGRQQHQRYRDAAAAAARARRAAARALGDCGDCLAHGAERAVATARLRLEGLARAVKARVEAGTEACTRGQEAVVKAVDGVPQAPVRVWLGRIAGSLVLGAILGGAVAYYAIPRAISTGAASSSSPPSCHAGGGGGGGGGGTAATAAAAEGTSPWWTTVGVGGGGGVGGESGASGGEPNFGDRLNKALFAARAGEAAAQQGLLEEVRNILAATGKSGGISAEQILRQFNAKRFKEASKAWTAAEGGNIAGSDPLDPLFFAPPSTPVHPSSASASQQQHQQHQHQPMPQQSPSIPPGAAPATECAGGASGSAFCSTDGLSGGGGGGGEPLRTVYTRTDSSSTAGGRPQYRRPCPGGWVC